MFKDQGADRICDDDGKYSIETYKLQDMFQSIEYPSSKIQSLLKTHNSIQKNQPEEVENTKTVVLPYVSGISENIATVCQ